MTPEKAQCTKTSCDGSFVKVPGIPTTNLFINCYEMGDTSLSLKRFVNRGLILSHQLIFPTYFPSAVEMKQEITLGISFVPLSSFLQLTGGVS